jgi:gliding-associated putative ABC transporter substrate-binding component GldG
MQKAGQISQTTIEILIVIAIVIVANIIGQYYYARADLTEDRQFTLADSSREIVSTLDEYVQLKAYVSPDLPPRLQQEETKLRDLLEEYQAAGNTKLTVQFVNPRDLSEEEIQTLTQRGINKYQVPLSEADRLSLNEIYFALDISYLGEHSVIPFVPNEQNLEYEITSAILRLTADELNTIGFLAGHGEYPVMSGEQSPYQGLTGLLEKLYQLQEIDISDGQPVPENVDTLIIVQPTMPFSERQQYVLDQFIMRGGKLIVMGNTIQEDQMSRQATFNPFPLESFLSEYGIKINPDLVADLDSNGPNIGGGLRLFYPLFPVITPEGFPEDNAATRGIGYLVFPYASSIELLYDKIADETEVIKLAESSPNSYSHPLPVSLEPQQPQAYQPPGGEADLKKQLVAVQLNGVFTSAFAGQPVPAFDLPPDAAEGQLPEMDTEPMITASEPTSIVVIGNSTFLVDGFDEAPVNGVFFQNLIESLNYGDALIDIRSRTVTTRLLDPELTTGQKNGLKFWGYMAVPIILTILGMGRFYLKNQRKKLMAAIHEAENKKQSKKTTEDSMTSGK